LWGPVQIYWFLSNQPLLVKLASSFICAVSFSCNMQMTWAKAQGHADIVEVLLLRELYCLLPPLKACKSDGEDDDNENNQRARSMITEVNKAAL